MAVFIVQGSEPTINAYTNTPPVNKNVTIPTASAVTDEYGRRVIKRGTPIGGFSQVYNSKGVIATDANVEGLVYVNQYVEDGVTEMTVPVMTGGWVNLDLVDRAVVTQAVQDALPMIGFIANGKEISND